MPDSGSAVESPLDRLRRLARESKAAKDAPTVAPAPAEEVAVAPATSDPVAEPVVAVPSLEERTFEEPSFEEPTFEESTFEESTFEESTFDEPVSDELVLDEPVFDEPAGAESEPEVLPEPSIEAVEQNETEPEAASAAQQVRHQPSERPGPPAAARLRATDSAAVGLEAPAEPVIETPVAAAIPAQPRPRGHPHSDCRDGDARPPRRTRDCGPDPCCSS